MKRFSPRVYHTSAARARCFLQVWQSWTGTSRGSSASDGLLFAAQQQPRRGEIPLQPLQSGGARGERVRNMWFLHRMWRVNKEAIHSQLGKWDRTGAKALLQSAPGVTGQRRRRRQGGGPGPPSSSPSSSPSSARGLDCTEAELIQNQNHVKTRSRPFFKCIQLDWQVWKKFFFNTPQCTNTTLRVKVLHLKLN